MASARARRIDDDLGRHIERTVRRLQLRVHQALVVSTPVLTGYARSGYSPSTGAPDPGPAVPDRNADVARAQAAKLFAKHKQASELLASGYRLSQGAVFIVNAVHYVRYLNQGTSAQAPALFVEAAIADGLKATRRELGG